MRIGSGKHGGGGGEGEEEEEEGGEDERCDAVQNMYVKRRRLNPISNPLAFSALYAGK